jgi:hypothetical protein
MRKAFYFQAQHPLEREKRYYDSNLTDAQWDFLKPMPPKPSQRGTRSPSSRRNR